MEYNDINLSNLILNKYTSSMDYVGNLPQVLHPTHSIAIMLEGSGLLTFENKKITLQEGDVFFIPQGSSYRSDWKTDSRSGSVTFFSMHFCFCKEPSAFLKSYGIQKTSAADAKGLEERYEKLSARILRDISHPSDGFAAAACFYEILALTMPHFIPTGNNSYEKKIRPALHYLEHNYQEDPSVEDLASLCFLSKPRFFALFKEVTGVSPIAYKNTVRLNHCAAYLLMHPDKSIEEVSSAFGYSTPVYFIRQFKKQFGATPFQYRKRAASPLKYPL